MSIESIFVLLSLVAAAALWAHHGRVSGKAASAAKTYLENQNLQFLDQSAVLKRVRVGWRPSRGPCLIRSYEFEFTHRGEYRYTGSLMMRGWQVQSINLPPIVETASPRTLH